MIPYLYCFMCTSTRHTLLDSTSNVMTREFPIHYRVNYSNPIIFDIVTKTSHHLTGIPRLWPALYTSTCSYNIVAVVRVI